MKRAKYRNKKTVVHGIKFDSKAESDRYLELLMLQSSGEISGLEMQVKFELIPKQGKERAAFYVADFVYSKGGEKVVEDVKGFKTAEYRLKRKLMLYMHGINILETGKTKG